MPFVASQPYNDLAPLPSRHSQWETPKVLKQAVLTARALATLNGASHLLPNPAVLVRLIGLREAQFSSEIENIVTTGDDLYLHASDTKNEAANPATKEVTRYNDALWYGYREITQNNRFLSQSLYKEIVAIVLHENTLTNVADIRNGKVRLGGRERTIYTPPEGRALLEKMLGDLDVFINAESDIDPLIKLAIIHYQFEAIHPFRDGNGRTGRIINILYLIQAGLLSQPILYLSSGFFRRRSEYYNGLLWVSERGAWENWICFFLEVIEETAKETFVRLQEIHQLMGETAEHIQQVLPKIYSKDLVEILFSQPYCKISFLVEAKIGHRDTSSRYLHALADAGFLVREERGRDIYFVNEPFLTLLKK
jgi:Fic family protein